MKQDPNDDEKPSPLFASKIIEQIIGWGVVVTAIIILIMFGRMAFGEILEAPPAKVLGPSTADKNTTTTVMEMPLQLEQVVNQPVKIIQPPTQIIGVKHIITTPEKLLTNNQMFIPLEDMGNVTTLYLNNRCIVIMGVPDSWTESAFLKIVRRTTCYIIQVDQTVEEKKISM